jgi:hypothetical protein
MPRTRARGGSSSSGGRSEKSATTSSRATSTKTFASPCLIGRLSATAEQSFLDEAVKCYEVGAYRAAIILTWILTLDHLYEFILKHHLASFNIELAKVKDKRVKVSVVSTKDDFGDIPENKFIEISRAANILSNDVRKILDQKLGTRNSYAHPTTLTLTPVKASEFIQDLITNVVLKYAL